MWSNNETARGSLQSSYCGDRLHRSVPYASAARNLSSRTRPLRFQRLTSLLSHPRTLLKVSSQCFNEAICHGNPSFGRSHGYSLSRLVFRHSTDRSEHNPIEDMSSPFVGVDDGDTGSSASCPPAVTKRKRDVISEATEIGLAQKFPETSKSNAGVRRSGQHHRSFYKQLVPVSQCENQEQQNTSQGLLV